MMDSLTSASLQFQKTPPVYFVSIALLLLLLVEREMIRAWLGVGKAAVCRVIDLAVLPLAVSFLFFIVLRVYTMLR
ncbi:MAG: hypothetical protein ACXVCO_15805 [Ktedonobacterales bacterium]